MKKGREMLNRLIERAAKNEMGESGREVIHGLIEMKAESEMCELGRKAERFLKTVA